MGQQHLPKYFLTSVPCWAWLGGNLCAIFIEARLVARLVARFISVVHKAHTTDVAKLVRKVNIEK